ncbi:glycoside hydrolase family 2 TIM barrel-domain containing protein [Luminiphilus sp. nBUS_07]|uniref:glycoside hydrolase family 2 protein n=1 Tax=Luminiphilus sp. nBUS_07 TaxID=3395314 RepID=UPI003EBEE006
MGKHLGTLIWAVLLSMLAANPLWAAEEDEEPAPFVTPELVVPEPASAVMGWVDSREAQSLNGSWKLLVDPMQVGTPGGFFGGWATTRTPVDAFQLLEYSYPDAADIRVPGDFNTQRQELFFYRDTVWYQRNFNVEAEADTRYHLWFGGANFDATVFLNGAPVARHKGGYVPFSVDVTAHLQPEGNDLVIRINNRLGDDTVPTGRTDWWPYGGLTRDVMLVATPEQYIVNAKVVLNNDRNAITAEVATEGFAAGDEVTVVIPQLDISQTARISDNGDAQLSIPAQPELWHPDAPKLYRVELAAGDDRVSDQIGFRTIETSGTTIMLNGEPIKFKGISTHEEPIGRDGVAYSKADMRVLFNEAKNLGVNFVRAAHYPYSRHAARVADEMGILLWEEVPIYWNIAWENADTLAIARDQISRLIERDWNRASVVIWSVANETPYSESRMKFLGRLIDDVRELDDSRLVSAALLGDTRRELKHVAAHLAAHGQGSDIASDEEKAIFQGVLAAAGEAAPEPGSSFTLVIDDPLGELVDIVSYNEYFGWYYARALAPQMGVSEQTIRKLMLQFIPQVTMSTAFGKPMFISEFGAGAKAGKRGEGVWTEDYQAAVYRAQIAMLSHSPQVQGMTPWILKDFRAMLRSLPGIQDYRNRKGLIDQNGRRKQAFYVLRDFYNGPWADTH